jgi:hypothetical protein
MMSKQENKDLTPHFGNTMLSAGFELINRYSNDDNADRRGRWARLLYYKGNLISWINRIDHIDIGRFYSVSDFFPTQNNDNPLYHESTKEKDFGQIVKEAELRFLSFLKSCR